MMELTQYRLCRTCALAPQWASLKLLPVLRLGKQAAEIPLKNASVQRTHSICLHCNYFRACLTQFGVSVEGWDSVHAKKWASSHNVFHVFQIWILPPPSQVNKPNSWLSPLANAGTALNMEPDMAD